jgi:dTDP-4-amino-4,6-dideoxygalactose transaminase
MRAALDSGRLAGGGVFSERAERLLEAELGATRVLLTPSCTAALEMAALLLDLAPGDEVIVPSFTFVSTANAFHLFGAKVIFADICPDTLNLDHTQVGRLITPRTRAIVPVHYAGVGAEMHALSALGPAIIEDNAHGLFGRYQNRPLGSFGAAATLSFHETKNFTCGEGGALVINNPGWVERAHILRDKGTNRSQFFLGQVDKYTWVDRGSSYLPSELSAAFLLAQLQRHQEVQSRRRVLWSRYQSALASWAAAHSVALPCVPADREQSFHMFYLLLDSASTRSRLIAHLAERGILAVFHYVPLHSSPRGVVSGSAPLGCPVTEDVSRRLLRVPFFTGLSNDDQDNVIRAILEFSP